MLKTSEAIRIKEEQIRRGDSVHYCLDTRTHGTASTTITHTTTHTPILSYN